MQNGDLDLAGRARDPNATSLAKKTAALNINVDKGKNRNNELNETKSSKTKPLGHDPDRFGPDPRDKVEKERDRVKAIINSSIGVSRKHLDALNANKPNAGTRMPSP